MSKRKVKQRKPTKRNQKKQIAALLSSGFFRTNWIYCLIIGLAVIAIYIQTLTYEHVLDDRIVIWDNTFTKQGFEGIWKIFSTESFAGYFGEQKDLVPGARYRPLSIVTFAIEYELFGLNPMIGHLGNIILYIILCIVLFRLYEDLLHKYSSPVKYISFGFCVALLFTIHPLHTEVVANIKGRDEIMSLLFSLLSLFYVLKSLDKGKWIYSALAAFCFFLGLMSKENTITFLAAIPLTCYYFSDHSLKNIFRHSFLLLISTIVYLVIRYQVVGYLIGGGVEIKELMNNPFLYMDFGEKYATIFYTLGLYLKLGFFPHPLTHDYYPFHIPTLNWGDFRSILSLALYLAMGVIALMGLRKKSLISYSILFYFITLSTASNLLFTVGTFMNERFLFTPLLGFCLVITYGLFQGLPKLMKGRNPMIIYIVTGIILAAYLGKSITRVPAWKNTLSLNSAAIKVSKNSARANTFMASALYQEQQQLTDPVEKGRILYEADEYSAKAIELLPDYTAANTVRAGVVADLFLLHRDLDILLSQFRLVALNKPHLPYLHEFYKYLNTTPVDKSKLAAHYYNLGYQEFFQNRRDFNAAIKYLRYGLDINAQNPAIHEALGQAYEATGNQQSANFHFQRANELRSVQ